MTRYRVVLFDWRLTLVHAPHPKWWIERALRSIGRPVDEGLVRRTFDSVDAAMSRADYIGAQAWIDSSAEQHRSVLLGTFRAAGLDEDFAVALYELDFDPACHPLYPDVLDVLSAIRARGVKLALVSNIHFDLRTDLAAHGVGHLFDAYVLSFEQGFQKPDPRMFHLALQALAIGPEEALMVGDSPAHDAGAVEAGVATLLLPPPIEPGPDGLGPRGLDIVLDMIG